MPACASVPLSGALDELALDRAEPADGDVELIGLLGPPADVAEECAPVLAHPVTNAAASPHNGASGLKRTCLPNMSGYPLWDVIAPNAIKS
jgi:hypothetical protein